MVNIQDRCNLELVVLVGNTEDLYNTYQSLIESGNVRNLKSFIDSNFNYTELQWNELVYNFCEEVCNG